MLLLLFEKQLLDSCLPAARAAAPCLAILCLLLMARAVFAAGGKSCVCCWWQELCLLLVARAVFTTGGIALRCCHSPHRHLPQVRQTGGEGEATGGCSQQPETQNQAK